MKSTVVRLCFALFVLGTAPSFAAPSVFVAQTESELVTEFPVTVGRDASTDVWLVPYRVDNLPAIRKGSFITVTLNKQLESPRTFQAGIAFLRRFELHTRDGKVFLLSPNLGTNLTREGHYDSAREGTDWIAPEDIAAGASVVWVGRARTSTVSGGVLKVLPSKGRLTVRIEQF